MRSIWVKNKKDFDYRSHTDQWIEQTAEYLKQNLVSALLFSEDISFRQLNGNKPTVLLEIQNDNSDIFNLLQVKNIAPDSFCSFFCVTSEEMHSLSTLFPVEHFFIRSAYTLLYGNDPIAGQGINREHLHQATITALHGIIIHIRAELIRGSIRENNMLVVQIMNRLIPLFKAILFLRANVNPTGLSALITEIESRYAVRRFVLSQILVDIENKKMNQLSQHILPLMLVLTEIIKIVESATGESA